MNYNSIDREAKEIHQRFPITRTTPTSKAQNRNDQSRNTDSDEDGGKTPDAIKTESPSVEGNDSQS